MKKYILSAAAAAIAISATASPKAIYVKKGDDITKYSFGVAGDLRFSNGGKTLTIVGYQDAINLDEIDYITFNAAADGSALTPVSQKEKLLQIGQEVNSMVDMNKNSDLILLFDAFFRDDRDNKPISKFSAPDQFKKIFEDTRSFIRSAQELAQGNTSAVATMRKAAVKLYKAGDFYGVFEADIQSGAWYKQKDADYAEFIYPGFHSEKYSVRLEPTEESDTWNTVDANVQLPKNVKITFFKNSQKIADANLSFDIKQDEYINIGFNFDSGSYVVANELKIVNTGIDDNTNVTFNGNKLADIRSHIEGNNLVNYDSLKDAIEAAQHSHDQNGNCLDDEDYSKLNAHFFRAQSDIDIIGKLQVNAKAFNLGKINDAMMEDDRDDDHYTEGKISFYAMKVVDWNPGTGHLVTASNSNDVVSNKEKYLNNYTDTPFRYDGDKKVQGYISWNIGEEREACWLPQDNDYTKYGYVIRDGYAIEALNKLKEDYNGESYWSGWHLVGDEIGENGETINGGIEIPVDESEVIHPSSRDDVFYVIEPQIIFPDLTTYEFGDYFTRSAFGNLIDNINTIVNTYYSITGQPGYSDL